MSSSLRRVVSDSDSEEDETKTTNKVNHRRQSEPPQEEDEPSKVLDSESEEQGVDSEEEETKSKLQQKQQQQDEEDEVDEIESESESESDHQDRKPVPQPQPRSRNAKKGGTKSKGGAVKVPLVTQIISGKRGRDVNGANGLKGGAAPTEEPLSKKMRGAAGGKDRSKSEKSPLSPGKSPSKKERKLEQAARGSTRGTAAAAKPEKGVLPTVVALAAASSKPENAKAQAGGGGRKRKASTPPPASARQQQAQRVVEDGDKFSPKPKKPFSWSSAVEECLVNELHEDCSNGSHLPSTKVDRYWENLLKRLPLEEDLTGLQLSDKVRRMRQRYFTLRDRANVDGAKFKSSHEEKMYHLWTDIWGNSPARKVSQPAVEVDHSEDESAETAATTAPRESNKRALRQSNNGEVSKDAATTNKRSGVEVGNGAENKGEASISEDEHDDDAIELTQRGTAGLNQSNATRKVLPEPVVTPFISKPRLAFTPLPPGEGKSKLAKRVEEVISDQHIEEGPPTDDEGKGDVVSSADPLKQFKEEMIRFFQELRSSFFPGIEEPMRGLGNLGRSGGVFVSGVLEGMGAGSGSPAARELQKKWRELKIQELALVSKRLHLMQEHCRLQQEELKLQNQGLDE